MGAERILITGGAGFIGCHLAKALLARGDKVRVLDSMIDQVHAGGTPDPVLNHVELIRADVRDPAAVTRAVQGVDAVVHLAAEVGVGQSMYAIERYVGVNDLGTAVLLEALLAHPVRRLVVASSMSVYGEGLYRDADGRLEDQALRGDRARTGSWDPVDDQGRRLEPVATPETKRPALASVYAISKYVQERLVLTVAPAYGMQATALRMFNVYGPGQALSNPYTGVLAIFASALLNGNAPQVFEDGEQRRDFVHVEDVARAFVLALTSPAASGQVFNIGSGKVVTIRETAEAIASAMGRREVRPVILGKARAGDIRHCFADISLARATLGYEPKRSFTDSLGELAEWVRQQQTVDRVTEARRELEARGLVA
ncbi:MAG: nucleoside-diphosphate-sugar epimerase [Rhodospirillales bacterium 20-64-7]|nr:MAG: nucleoside-diphosphate-sugar epimerase [Rhodospirillales bacterium 20-64-7]HQT76466.1 NAD-dependent epimerase/dehydratase family protein [Rhodopila sp.]